MEVKVKEEKERESKMESVEYHYQKRMLIQYLVAY